MYSSLSHLFPSVPTQHLAILCGVWLESHSCRVGTARNTSDWGFHAHAHVLLRLTLFTSSCFTRLSIFIFLLSFLQRQIQTFVSEAKPRATGRFSVACILEGKWPQFYENNVMVVGAHCGPICISNCSGDLAWCTNCTGSSCGRLAMFRQGCGSWFLGAIQVIFRPEAD